MVHLRERLPLALTCCGESTDSSRPSSWVAAALTVVLLLAGPSLIGAEADKTAAAGSAAAGAPDGKEIFVSNCGGCHTLARAETTGSVGPNLDDLKPDAATVKATVSSGKGTMPAFEDTLSAAEIDAVAAFVAGDEPAAATPSDRTPEPAEVTTARHRSAGRTASRWRTTACRRPTRSAGTLQRFDASTGRAIGEPLAVGRQPDNPLVAGGAIWVALGGDDAVAPGRGQRGDAHPGRRRARGPRRRRAAASGSPTPETGP